MDPKNDIELAEAIPCDPKSIWRWRERRDLPPAPKTRNVQDWLDWLKLKQLGPYSPQHGYGADRERSSDDEPEAQAGATFPPNYAGALSDWNRAKVAKEVEKRDVELDQLRGKLIDASELDVPIGAMLGAIQTRLNQFPFTSKGRVLGIRDEMDAERILRDEIDAVLLDISATRYLDEKAIADAVASLPFDQETETLLSSVLFENQDRSAFLSLVTSVSTQALRLIGRAAIDRAQRAEETAEPEPTSQGENESPRPSRSGSSDPSDSGGSDSGSRKSRKRSRPHPTPPPGEVEGAMVDDG